MTVDASRQAGWKMRSGQHVKEASTVNHTHMKQNVSIFNNLCREKRVFLRQVCKLFFMVEMFPLKIMLRGFPGGPVTKIPPSQCKGPRFNPRSGN